jgi:hypothetical protein
MARVLATSAGSVTIVGVRLGGGFVGCLPLVENILLRLPRGPFMVANFDEILMVILF